MRLVSLTGFAAYLLLFGSVAGGTLLSESLRRRRPSGWLAHSHEALSLAAFALVLVHAAAGLPAGRQAWQWLAFAAPPGTGPAVPLGVAALYAVIVVVASFYLRRRFGSPLWRRLHLLSYPAFAAAAWHGLAMGPDAWLAPVRLMYLVTLGCAGLLLAGRAIRALVRPSGTVTPASPRRRGDRNR